MRYLVIVRQDQHQAWIVAETPDENVAWELAATFSDAVVLGEDEAGLDPDFRRAVGAWKRRDDTVWRRMRDEADACDVIEEVWQEYLARKGEPPVAEPDED